MTGANPASEEVMSLQRPIPSLARPLSRLSPLTLALRCALLGLSAVGAGLLGGGLAHAQSVGQHSAATRLDDATPRSYDIPAGSLSASLGAFASQSGLLLSFDPALTRGRTAPALKGRYSVLEGLQRVLSNTGLQVAAGTSGAYLLVEPRMSGEAPADLSPVVVSAA
ncbi:STN domain-containing protein, partial [Pseudomonas aeruginosa]|nr:STN domain-containing protein [Pseudomonas aeruginosa]